MADIPSWHSVNEDAAKADPSKQTNMLFEKYRLAQTELKKVLYRSLRENKGDIEKVEKFFKDNRIGLKTKKYTNSTGEVFLMCTL